MLQHPTRPTPPLTPADDRPATRALEPVEHRYLLVSGIPCRVDAAGRRWIYALWHKDRLEHLRYLSDFTLACPVERLIGVPAGSSVQGSRCRVVDRCTGVLCALIVGVCSPVHPTVPAMVTACAEPRPLYRPRDPQASDLWRLFDEHFTSFQQVYDERYQAKYG